MLCLFLFVLAAQRPKWPLAEFHSEPLTEDLLKAVLPMQWVPELQG